MPRMDTRLTALLESVGRVLPNPAMAKVSFEVLVRAAEIAYDRAGDLAAAMTGPEVLIEPHVADIGLRDFDRLEQAIEAGRAAARAALPALRRVLASPPWRVPRSGGDFVLHVDPVCGMAVSPGRARAVADRDGTAYYFCSENCRHVFDVDPARFIARRAVVASTV